MCFMKSPSSSSANQQVKQTIPEPQPTAEPTAIGTARKQEDQSLFGGIPDLRVAHTAPTTGSTAGGSGLKLM